MGGRACHCSSTRGQDTNVASDNDTSMATLLDGWPLEQAGEPKPPRRTSEDTTLRAYSPSEVAFLSRAANIRKRSLPLPDKRLGEDLLTLLWEEHPHARATLELRNPGISRAEILQRWEVHGGHAADTSTWLPQEHGPGSLSYHDRGW